MRTPPSALLAGGAALAAAMALAACGGSSSPSAAAASEQSREREDEVKFADFARCLREHGIPASNEGGLGLRVGGPGGSHGPVSREKMEAAQNACKKYRPAPRKVNLSPRQKVQMEEAVLKFARCMREHGVDVHTSTAGGGIQIGIHRGPGGPGAGPNPESPAFQTAQKDCSGLLPRPPGAKRPGGPGGPPPGGPLGLGG